MYKINDNFSTGIIAYTIINKEINKHLDSDIKHIDIIWKPVPYYLPDMQLVPDGFKRRDNNGVYVNEIGINKTSIPIKT